MSEPDLLPSHVHRESTLLPWYVNGTLQESERQLVDRHLANCAVCRMELDEMTRLRRTLHTVYAAQPGPTSQAARQVLDTVAREAAARTMPPGETHSWMEAIDAWLRSCLMPRWAPSLAVLLLVAQLGLLLWATSAPQSQHDVTTRSLGPATVRFDIAFTNESTEAQIRSVLHMVRGRITDGPTADGTYRLDVLAESEEAAARKLELLRARTDVVRAVSLFRP